MTRYENIGKRLINLEIDKVRLKSLEDELELIELEYNLKGIAYDGIGGSGGIGDTVGDTAINLAERKIDIQLKIARLTKEIEHLEGVLSKLTDTERNTVILYYPKHKKYHVIAREVGYSISQVKRIKKDAMDKIVRGIYGE